MLARLKQYLLLGGVVYVFYFFLSNHFILYTWTDFDLLPKKELTLAYTFYSLGQNTTKEALSITALREDGLGDLMLAQGMISQEELDGILREIDSKSKRN